MSRDPVTTYAVCCNWQDQRRVPCLEGHEAVVVTAADSNEALDVAYAARPDLWAEDGMTRRTSVYPAQIVQAA